MIGVCKSNDLLSRGFVIGHSKFGTTLDIDLNKIPLEFQDLINNQIKKTWSLVGIWKRKFFNWSRNTIREK